MAPRSTHLSDDPPPPWPTCLCPSVPRTRPYYRWLQKCILSCISQRVWVSGQRIPNEWDIAKGTNLNINTVKKALLGLVEQGYLVRIRKRGTFVANFLADSYRYLFYPLALSFTDTSGVPLSTLEALENTRGSDSGFPREFACGPEQFRLSRRMYYEGQPVMYTRSWLCATMYPGFDRLPLARFKEEPLYSILDRDYNIMIRKSSELLAAVPADEQIASILSLKQGAPILRSRILNYTDNDAPCEYRESYIDTSFFSLRRNLL